MRIGSAIALIVIGAILSFALQPDLVSFININLVGYIMMAAGVIGLILAVVLSRPKPLNHVSESRTINDPATGETVTRNEIRDNGGLGGGPAL